MGDSAQEHVWVAREYTCPGTMKPKGRNDDKSVFSPQWLTSTDKLLDGPFAFAAVFDGHGGDQVSTYAEEHMANGLKEWLRANIETELPQNLESFFRSFDSDIVAKKFRGGSTACVSLVSKKVIHVANLGDSRAVLARVPNTENGKIETIELSQDHHPSLEAEKKRIEDGGGFVEKFFGTTRACAASSSVMLAVSRAFGDTKLKFAEGVTPRAVISDIPEVTSHNVIEDEDTMLVIVSDGITSVMSSEQITQTAMQATLDCMSNAKEKEEEYGLLLRAAGCGAQAVVDLALANNTNDDATCVCLLLPAFHTRWKCSTFQNCVPKSEQKQQGHKVKISVSEDSDRENKKAKVK
eukprot:m.339943 g.339943  ORF g.339943 m.339943 type:complete len:352 (-) comp19044_c0_seq1:1097-2152(-)